MLRSGHSDIGKSSLVSKIPALFMVLLVVAFLPFVTLGNEDLQPVDVAAGVTSNGKLGWNVTKIGDFSGDGIPDYAVGAPGENRVYIFKGQLSSTFTFSAPDWRITGPTGSNFGWDVNWIESYNGDIYDDLIVGAPGESKAYVFKGTATPSTSWLQTNAAITISGTSTETLGHSVAGIEYDGTNNMFAMVGAPTNTHTIDMTDYMTGAVFLFNLSYLNKKAITTVDTTTGPNITFVGDPENGWFGFTVKNLGDVNGDGIDDLGVGDPYYSPSGSPNNGALHIHYGKNVLFEQPVIRSSSMNGYIFGRNQSKFGWSISSLGDIRAGSEDDFMVGAPLEGPGHAYMFFGSMSAFMLDLSLPGAMADAEFFGERMGDRFGWSMSLTRILDETTAAVTVGAPGYDNGTMNGAGAIFTFWEWPSIENASNSKSKFYGESSGDGMGYAVAEANVSYETPNEVVLASAPYYGTSNTGMLMVFKRNRLPSITSATYIPPKGNLNIFFTFTVTYKDFEGDDANYVRVEVFSDIGATDLKTTVSLGKDPTDPSTIQQGLRYKTTTKLPNSIKQTSPDEPLYLRAIAAAKRGSVSEIKAAVVPGPVVDGVNPSKTSNINVLPAGEIEGTFKLSWEWPEEDEGFLKTGEEGKVRSLHIRFFEGNKTITNENWNTAEQYRTYTMTQCEFPLTIDELHFGLDDPTTNPFDIVFEKEAWYTIAFRAEDEVGNLGNVSTSIVVQAYVRPDEIPGACIEVTLMDYKGENGTGDYGGKLKIIFTPPQMTYFEDIKKYWVFVDTKPFHKVSDISWEPDHIITPANFEEFKNFTVILSSYHGGGLQNGTTYNASVVPLNRKNQYTDELLLSEGAKVINDNLPALPKITGVNAMGLDHQKKIKVTWDAVTDPRFVSYEVWGQSYSFSDINDAVPLAIITDRTVDELIVENISGEAINQEKLYSFAVLVKDHNDHMDIELNEFNTVRGVKYTDSPGYCLLDQMIGVSLKDVPNDDGGALRLTWFNLIVPLHFWEYRIYVDDEEITSIEGMEPYGIIGNFRTGEYEITEFDGERLLDGKYYFAVVTVVDYNLEENSLIDANNSDTAKPINQSDYTPPSIRVSGLQVDESSITDESFVVLWSPVLWEDIMDFDHYLVRYSGATKGELNLEGFSSTTATIDGLERGKLYYVNVTAVDDVGLRGPPSTTIEVWTSGMNMPPNITLIQVTIEETLNNLTNDQELKVDKDAFLGEIYFTAFVTDDYTRPNKLFYFWNITTPKGETSEKSNVALYQFGLDLPDYGVYTITLMVQDDEGAWSEEYTIKINAKQNTVNDGKWEVFVIIAFVMILLIAIIVIVFVTITGKRSQQKQVIAQYEDRRKSIETLGVIYTDLPTWTCSCGTTQVQILESATCPACYESHEGVPITGMDQYLKDHDLVLSEMRIKVPPGWKGQDDAQKRAETDLADRKKRGMDSLNQEFAPFLKGTQYEKDIPKEEAPTPQVPQEDIQKKALHHEGAIIPGQIYPQSPVQQPAPMQPMMAPQPMPYRPGQPQPMQPGMRPAYPMPMAPGQRPPGYPYPGAPHQMGQPQPVQRPPQQK